MHAKQLIQKLQDQPLDVDSHIYISFNNVTYLVTDFYIDGDGDVVLRVFGR